MSSGYNPWLDDTLLRQNLAQHFVRMAQKEKEKKEMRNCINDAIMKNSYFVYDGRAFDVDEITEHHEGYMDQIHTLDVSVNLKKPRNMKHYPTEEVAEYCKADIENTSELCKKAKAVGQPKIKNVIFNDPATIVFWTDGTKTVVKAQGNDIFDPEKGLAMAMAKKFLGNQGNYYNEFAKWLPEEEVESEQPMGEVMEMIEDEYGITVRFEPNEALKKAIEELTDVKFNVPSSMGLVSKEKEND